MEEIKVSNEYFNPIDTLSCGQLFRFSRFKDGYRVISKDKACYLYSEGDKTVVRCESQDVDYFCTYFDLKRDYSFIVNSAKTEGGILEKSANLGKGVRILNQDITETLFSFMVSQNNNIPRIKLILENLSTAFGDEKVFMGEKYRAFPKVEKMANADISELKKAGLGYRAEYIKRLAEEINNGFNPEELSSLTTEELRKRLLNIYGVGQKVADCVLLFGYRKSDAFPVDTWIEKVYVDNFGGTLKDRAKISEWFTGKFGENSGYYQQYLFYYKRSLEKTQ